MALPQETAWTWVLSSKHWDVLRAGGEIHLHGHGVEVVLARNKEGILTVEVIPDSASDPVRHP